MSHEPTHRLNRASSGELPAQPLERERRYLVDGYHYRSQARLGKLSHAHWYRKQQAKMPPGMTMPPLEPEGQVAADPEAVAEVNHGRWIARCPLCAGGAEIVDPEFPYFWCTSCANEKAGGQYLPLDVADQPTRAEVARILLARPLRRNQNWRADLGEPIERLREENTEHDLPEQLDRNQVEVR